ncbi:MAG TPA: dihydrolipoyl dehydrogenase [Planctomycetota bacterium]|jgi:dihydrolipoamide dehydrogenase|nr:dihydrolipoyl dehydrogenase [Planctomycetota bacterium]
MPPREFDAVVVGAGPAGYVCAIRLAQLGKKVAVVERDSLGGCCLNVGCIPSKALIAAGSFFDRLKRAPEMGIEVSGARVDLAKMVAWKDSIVAKLTGGIGSLFRNHKIESVKGTATLKSRSEVEVKGGAGAETLRARALVLATGSEPIPLKEFPWGEAVWSSTEALAPKALPKRLLVIGGGYIGLELGTFYAKVGAQVTVVEMTAALLPGTDPDLSAVVARTLKKRGVAVHLNARAAGYEQTAAGLRVEIEAAGKKTAIECDRILSTVGRRPCSTGLGLEALGVRTEKGFVAVDPRRETSVPGVFAIGDLAGQPMLAHKGSKEGVVAAEAIAGRRAAFDARAIPAVIFTDPEIASVGLTETEAKGKGFDPVVGRFPFAASGRAMSLGETEGFVKVVADRGTDAVLGVHMVGPEVTELVAEAALAIEMGATAEDLALTIHAHPTLPETIMEAAEAVHGAAIHIYQRP